MQGAEDGSRPGAPGLSAAGSGTCTGCFPTGRQVLEFTNCFLCSVSTNTDLLTILINRCLNETKTLRFQLVNAWFPYRNPLQASGHAGPWAALDLEAGCAGGLARATRAAASPESSTPFASGPGFPVAPHGGTYNARPGAGLWASTHPVSSPSSAVQSG